MSGINRRKFFKTSTAGLLALTPFYALPKDIQKQLIEFDLNLVSSNGLSILQGMTTEQSTELSIDVPKKLKLNYLLKEVSSGRTIQPYHAKWASRTSSSWRVDKIKFKEMRLGEVYQLHVIDDKNQLIDMRELEALDLNKAEASVGMISCVLDIHSSKADMWKGVESLRPDMLFFMGDNVYGDIGGFIHGPNFLWSRYLQTRSSVPFYKQKKLIPVVGIWDDHDYGKNNSDGSYRYKKESLTTFKAFMAQDNVASVFESGPANSYCFDAFGQRFIMLDDQYYLGLGARHNGYFWGSKQFQWAQDKILTANKPLWLLQGGQFFGRYLKKGSTEELSQGDLQKLCGVIQESGQPALFASGDIHFAQYMKLEQRHLGYETFEFTSSSMHSSPSSKDASKNPRAFYQSKKHNWNLLKLANDSQGSSAYEMVNIGALGKPLFSKKIIL